MALALFLLSKILLLANDSGDSPSCVFKYPGILQLLCILYDPSFYTPTPSPSHTLYFVMDSTNS